MIGSRWQANKIGLINFWYYDEQEFAFAKGRMLLRGSNGSGKSVTMQSVIPLLLDGNMSPERLDPFRSKDRKMISYLLEDGDEREERIGYLYLEFKRESSDTYITIGMGIRARKGKPLEKWYFGLTDGRRIGHDFFLYKEMGDKITLTKKELSNRVGLGGQVMEHQTDYMEFVNRQIFGFDTIDEYKEMIDLLIQLRTPKLSKDFKPTVINEILSDSLQPLSDEELRPMSEAIENMDTNTMNLKARQEGKVAAEKINRVLDRYNRLLLWEKAVFCVENEEEIVSITQKLKELEKNQKKGQELFIQLEEEEQYLGAKKDAFEQERELFQQSDLWNLKTKENELQEEIHEAEQTLTQKDTQLSGKEEVRIQIEGKKKEEQDRKDSSQMQLISVLEELEDDAEMMAFQETTFMANELRDNLDQEYSFQTHDVQFVEAKNQIKIGCDHLKECEFLQRQVEELLKKRDDSQRQVDTLERRNYELHSQFMNVQGEWKEALYGWNGRNQEMKLSQELLQSMSGLIDQYDLQTDYGVIRNMMRPVYDQGVGNLELLRVRESSKKKECEEHIQELQRELREWEEQKEPVPNRSEEVMNNREKLKQLGIPYYEFYKLLEFNTKMSAKECNDLEEALLHMGILDAVVLDEQYREQILSLENGTCDRYLFMQKGMAENSLLDVLELNDNLIDIFLNQKMVNILGHIGFHKSATTAIWEDGSYQIGVITGTITGNYEAGFLGTKAREKNRRNKIEACIQKIEGLKAVIQEQENTLQVLEGRKAQIQQEYVNFPNDQDLRTALTMLDEVLRNQKQYKKNIEEYEADLEKVSKQKNEKNNQAVQIAQKLYLSCTLSVFMQAGEAAISYERKFYELKNLHSTYLHHVKLIDSYEEQIGNIMEDMDQILYDISKLKKTLRDAKELYESVKEQLQAEGFEEKQQRMEECVTWLKAYPSYLTDCIKKKEKVDHDLMQWSEQEEQNKKRLEEYQRKEAYLSLCYEKELNLSYVNLPEEIKSTAKAVDATAKAVDATAKAVDATAKAVADYLGVDCKSMSKNKETQSLNEVVFENQNYLGEYQITRRALFEELDGEKEISYPEASRIDIQARYMGVKVSFGKLLEHLTEEIEDLQTLIRDGDRELFEDILANTVSRKIRGKINASNAWVEKMNGLMNSMNTSSGLRLSLKWRHKTAENENQLDTKELVEYLKKDYRMLREEEAEKLSLHFRSKVEEARRRAKDSGGTMSFYQVMKDTLDYRKWFEFQLFSQKSGERLKELTNSVFGTFSGGEKAMAMYVPLFSAVVAKYQGGSQDAPRIISLDEAFAGVDNRNIRDMFRLMAEFDFEFIINSQVLWGDVDTLDALAIYQLNRLGNAKFVTIMPYIWNGQKKELLENEEHMERRASELS